VPLFVVMVTAYQQVDWKMAICAGLWARVLMKTKPTAKLTTKVIALIKNRRLAYLTMPKATKAS
jgi:hypothetical protein